MSQNYRPNYTGYSNNYPNSQGNYQTTNMDSSETHRTTNLGPNGYMSYEFSQAMGSMGLPSTSQQMHSYQSYEPSSSVHSQYSMRSGNMQQQQQVSGLFSNYSSSSPSSSSTSFRHQGFSTSMQSNPIEEQENKWKRLQNEEALFYKKIQNNLSYQEPANPWGGNMSRDHEQLLNDTRRRLRSLRATPSPPRISAPHINPAFIQNKPLITPEIIAPLAASASSTFTEDLMRICEKVVTQKVEAILAEKQEPQYSNDSSFQRELRQLHSELAASKEVREYQKPRYHEPDYEESDYEIEYHEPEELTKPEKRFRKHSPENTRKRRRSSSHESNFSEEGLEIRPRKYEYRRSASRHSEQSSERHSKYSSKRVHTSDERIRLRTPSPPKFHPQVKKRKRDLQENRSPPLKQIKPKNKKVDFDNSKNFLLYCPLCVKYFDTSKQFELHIWTAAHKSREEKQLTSKWQCKPCGIKEMVSLEAYTNHINTEEHHSQLLLSLDDDQSKSGSSPDPKIDWDNYEEQFDFPIKKINPNSALLESTAIFKELKKHQRMDLDLRIVHKQMFPKTSAEVRHTGERVILKNKLLAFETSDNSTLYLVPRSAIKLILYNYHVSKSKNTHLSLNETILRISRHFVWTGLYNDATSYIEACQKCSSPPVEDIKIWKLDLSNKPLNEVKEMYKNCQALEFSNIIRELKYLQNLDEKIIEIVKSVRNHEPEINGHKYVMVDDLLGILLPETRYIVPSTGIKWLINKFHHLNKHLDIKTTFELISKLFYWDDMYWDIIRIIVECFNCSNKHSNITIGQEIEVTFEGLLQKLKSLQPDKSSEELQLKNDRYVVPKGGESLVLNYFHQTEPHKSLKKCVDEIVTKFYWPTIYADIHQYVKKCERKKAKSTIVTQSLIGPDEDSVKFQKVLDKLKMYQKHHSGLNDMMYKLKHNARFKIKNYKMKNGVLAYTNNSCYAVPPNAMRLVFNYYHRTFETSEHPSFEETYQAIKKQFFWREMRPDVVSLIQNCSTKCYDKLPEEYKTGIFANLRRNYDIPVKIIELETPDLFHFIRTFQELDPEINEIREELKTTREIQIDTKRFVIHDNMVCLKAFNKFCPYISKKIMNLVIFNFHSKTTNGNHINAEVTHKMLLDLFYFPINLYSAVMEFVSDCVKCTADNARPMGHRDKSEFLELFGGKKEAETAKVPQRHANIIQEIKRLQEIDVGCNEIKEKIRKFRDYKNDGLTYILVNRVLCAIDDQKKERYVIPTLYKYLLIKYFHDNKHINAETTNKIIMDTFYWPTIEQDVKKFIQFCETCNPKFWENFEPVADLEGMIDVLRISHVTTETYLKIYRQVLVKTKDMITINGHVYTIYKDALARQLPTGKIRVIVPKKYISFILTSNHLEHKPFSSYHSNVTRYFNWGTVDKDTSTYYQSCEVCSKNGNMQEEVKKVEENSENKNDQKESSLNIELKSTNIDVVEQNFDNNIKEKLNSEEIKPESSHDTKDAIENKSNDLENNVVVTNLINTEKETLDKTVEDEQNKSEITLSDNITEKQTTNAISTEITDIPKENENDNNCIKSQTVITEESVNEIKVGDQTSESILNPTNEKDNLTETISENNISLQSSVKEPSNDPISLEMSGDTSLSEIRMDEENKLDTTVGEEPSISVHDTTLDLIDLTEEEDSTQLTTSERSLIDEKKCDQTTPTDKEDSNKNKMGDNILEEKLNESKSSAADESSLGT